MKNFMKMAYAGLILFLFVACTAENSEPVNIIPKPNQIKMGSGYFQFTGEISLISDTTNEQLNSISKFVSSHLGNVSGLELTTNNVKASSKISLLIDKEYKSENKEAYRLEVLKDEIILKGNSLNGVFYACQSLIQLLPPEIESKTEIEGVDWKIPCVVIEDEPRFAYRGMHLDVSRHFMPKEFIKKYIDMLAMNKINKFHWHLTDDQGWRIEIKKYPKLTEVGACRVERTEMWHVRPFAREDEEPTYCGHYTQEEIKEIVAYAAERYIDVIPEIDMPGHCVAILASYPEYACDNEKYLVIPGGYWPPKDVLCVGDDATLSFLKDVLAEVFELFPYKYVHIGGDEAVKTKWETCPKCQKRIEDHKLANVKELQSWFIREMEKFIMENDRRLIGWEEILEGGLAPEATVMSWTGEEGGIEAAKMNHDVIMTPLTHVYFDYFQNNPETEPMAMSNNFTPLRKVYDYEPMPEELPGEKQKYVLGAQANVWTEFIPTPEHAEYMTSTRMSALAEVVWTNAEEKDYADFYRRMQDRFKRFEYLDIKYSKGSDIVEFRKEIATNKISMHSDIPQAKIYYTLDGSKPTNSSEIYTMSVEVSVTDTIRAVIYIEDHEHENSYSEFYLTKYDW